MCVGRIVRNIDDEIGARNPERELAVADEPRLRRLGLAALVGLAQTPGGRSPDRLALLAAYRADRSALVAGPARCPDRAQARLRDPPSAPRRRRARRGQLTGWVDSNTPAADVHPSAARPGRSRG